MSIDYRSKLKSSFSLLYPYIYVLPSAILSYIYLFRVFEINFNSAIITAEDVLMLVIIFYYPATLILYTYLMDV